MWVSRITLKTSYFSTTFYPAFNFRDVSVKSGGSYHFASQTTRVSPHSVDYVFALKTLETTAECLLRRFKGKSTSIDGSRRALHLRSVKKHSAANSRPTDFRPSWGPEFVLSASFSGNLRSNTPSGSGCNQMVSPTSSSAAIKPFNSFAQILGNSERITCYVIVSL